MVKKKVSSNKIKTKKEKIRKEDITSQNQIKDHKPNEKKNSSTTNQVFKEPQTMDELLSQVGDFSLGLKKGSTVEGVVVSVGAREILIDIGKKSFGIVAEWELEQVRDYAATLKPGDKITAQVVNPENEIGYTVLSLRKTSLERRWQILQEKKEKGEEIEVMGLDTAKGGVLVEWQGLRGFIPATQLDASFASNPALLIARKAKVKILEVDRSLNRLVVSQKAVSLGLSPALTKEKLSKIKPGDILKGVVSGTAPFGLFVDVDGLEGLVHISEIAWEKVTNPSALYKVGDKIEVTVLDINQDEGKLNLSIKRLTPDPWKNILDRYPPDSTVTGQVVRHASYGIFVKLEVGIEGLIHISRIPAGTELKEGETVECLIEKVDEIKRKISLTLVPKAKPVGYR